MIQIQNLTHHYGLRPVLKDISMEVTPGELVVLLGPNGMGKSTLLGCMAGTLWPARGQVAFDGVCRRQSVAEERQLRQRIAYLPDNAWLPVMRTGREFILSIGKLHGVDELRMFDHADRLLRLFNLAEQGDSPISSYSAGQKKKIALCSALITDTPYMLLDEPFSGGLDPAGILALKEVLKQLKRDRGVTIVMTTPVPELIGELADRVAIIRRGELAAYDTPEGLRQQAGNDLSLSEALEQLVFPETHDSLKAYFAAEENRL